MSLNRLKNRAIACPKCGAPVGVSCSNKRGEERRSNHRERRAPQAIVRIQPKDAFYMSEEWRRVRYQALRKHGGACQCCGAIPSVGSPLHVDHIKPRSRFPSLSLDLNNLQVLCADCNLGKGATDTVDWRR